MCDVYKNIDEYNSHKENKILIVFDDIIADMIHNKKLNSIVTKILMNTKQCKAFLVSQFNYFPLSMDVLYVKLH